MAKKSKFGKGLCNRCGSSEKLINYSTNRHNGKVFRYYHCRKCNTKRHKKYRQTEQGKKNVRKAVKRSILKHAEKQKARLILRNAIVTGKIKKGVCKCGSRKTEAHHPDYKKPLLVTWMCRSCHADLHRHESRRIPTHMAGQQPRQSS